MPDRQKLSSFLQHNVDELIVCLGDSDDLEVRKIDLGREGALPVALLYLDGLTDENMIFRLMESLRAQMDDREEELGSIQDFVITVGDTQVETTLKPLLQALLSGGTIVLLEGDPQALVIATEGWQQRQVTEPLTQTVIRGPHEGFTEDIQTNITLVRRRVRDPRVWMEKRRIGRITHTAVALMYIDGTVQEDVLEEVRRRLGRIDIDGILESNYIEEFIQDETATVFPLINNTERPDVVAAAILEGRVAIFVDGTPYVLTVPAVLTEFLQSAEDYYHRSDLGLLRSLRYLSVFISILAPAVYISMTTFHQEMMPPVLLVSIAAQREGVPFPSLIEALILETVLELLREASVRMPRAVGTAISIVGALVLGEAAVTAGLVSEGMVIVVAITAIAGFIFPSFEIGISFRVLRFVFMLLAGVFGFFGMTIGLIALTLHLCRLSSFGIPYMAPIAPFSLSDQQDTIARVPWWQMYTRPTIFNLPNEQRQSAVPKTEHDAGRSKGPEEGNEK